MAKAIVTIKVMPSSPETDLKALEELAAQKIKAFSGNDELKVEIIPVAFGLKSLNLTFVIDESLGSPESLEKELQALEGVNSAETVDVRRAVG
ncbi:MAG: elongation factor 1-beta [Candidatus Woesearchaeota archaeon]